MMALTIISLIIPVTKGTIFPMHRQAYSQQCLFCLLSAMNNSLFAGLMIKQYGEGIKEELSNVIDKDCFLTPEECSVYSLGESVNGEGFYCKSVVDPETGMIDSNALDGVSLLLSAEFGKLEDVLLSHNK